MRRFRSITAVTLVAGALVGACRTRAPEAAGSTAPVSTTAAPVAATTALSATPAPGANPQKLLGRWLRADSDYVIEILQIKPEGYLEAKYFNPNPIHVSRAGWKTDGEHVGVAVELTDKNYPGNFYTLVYDPGSDALIGTYQHLGQNQSYEVSFSRVDSDPPTPVP